MSTTSVLYTLGGNPTFLTPRDLLEEHEPDDVQEMYPPLLEKYLHGDQIFSFDCGDGNEGFAILRQGKVVNLVTIFVR